MLLNFQKQFAGKVKTGRKRCTIRKRPARVGELLHLYTGLRSKKARRLRKPVKCVDCWAIEIKESGLVELVRDGFKDAAAMLAWFRKTHGLPFRGFLITW